MAAPVEECRPCVGSVITPDRSELLGLQLPDSSAAAPGSNTEEELERDLEQRLAACFQHVSEAEERESIADPSEISEESLLEKDQ